jgi:hypothetical protein
MKHIFTFLLTLSALSRIYCQSFEGEIIYANTFKSKINNLTDQQLSAAVGSRQEYYIKKGDYKSVTNGSFPQWQLYINADNRLYNKISSSDTVLWNDASENADVVLSSQLNKGTTNILGYTCDELILTCKSGIQKYYFNSKLATDTKLYARHQYGNWYYYLSKANALPLKIIIDNVQFSMESVATEIKPLAIDAKFFQLPEGTKTAKSPY